MSPCGWGNLGDAAIIDSLIQGIRARVPSAAISGFTLNPSDTSRRHGVEAHAISSMPMPFYPIHEAEEEPGGTPAPSPSPPAREGRFLEGARRAAHQFSPLCSVAGLLLAANRLRREPEALRNLSARLSGTTAVIVAGGGQLDARFGGLFGQPYVLWRWGRVARSVGARFLVLSVGTGTLGPASRRLCVRALEGADYRSYRDEQSRALLGSLRLTRDPIVPDLAYAVPVRPQPPPGRSRLVAGVSPMTHGHPKFNPGGSLRRYQQHLKAMAVVCRELLTGGADVMLFTTDGSDEIAVRDLLERLGPLGPELRARLTVAETRTIPELWEAYARVDVVVAARLHAALLAHVAHRPVFAFAHERKVAALMSDMGHARFCCDILSDDEGEIGDRLRALCSERTVLAGAIRSRVAVLREKVEAQYDGLFGALPHEVAGCGTPDGAEVFMNGASKARK